MLNISLNEWILIAKSRDIREYHKGMYEDELLWALNASELVKENESVRDMREGNFDTDKMSKNAKEEDIRGRVLRDIRNLYRLEKVKKS